MDTPVSTDYVRTQLARALATAHNHTDPAVRKAAERRAHSWKRVRKGMEKGTLAIGSRTPVRHLPAWVTPEVIHGGFATGLPAAGGPLRPHEEELARRHGLPADRSALYTHHLTEEGIAALTRLLDSGDYALDQPEQAALLAVAWLLRAGDTAGALDLIAELDRFAPALCLTPRPEPHHALPPGTVHRRTVAEVRTALDERAQRTGQPHALREALTVWNPFADRVLAHWLETADDSGPDAHRPQGWSERGAALLAEYERLAAEHTLCTKHRKPGRNLAILLAALREALSGELSPRLRGLLRHAADSMVAKRGRPGSERHIRLRARQAAQAALPTHDMSARLLSARLEPLPQSSGVPGIDRLLSPVTAEEARRFGMPEGHPLPGGLRTIAARAAAAPLGELVERGVVPSAEVLAELVPALAAQTEAGSSTDPALARLLSAHRAAFSRRRSLLLLNLEHQVRAHELPWIRALERHRDAAETRRRAARELILHLGNAVLTHFPGTIVPNPLVRELDSLARAAELDVPFVEELAADIFTGRFTPKFARAAELAARQVRGSLYARYYGLAPEKTYAPKTFAALCHSRADNTRGRPLVSPARNGTVIEQAQILTTHNLAALVELGARPAGGWAEAARRSLASAVHMVAAVPREGGYADLPRIKNAAFAWRQGVFFLSRCSPGEQREELAETERRVADLPEVAQERLRPALGGLRAAQEGRPAERGVLFLGWSVGPHRMLRIGR